MIYDVSKLSQNDPKPTQLNPSPISMTKINVMDVVTDDATYSPINDIDIDVASDMADDIELTRNSKKTKK